MNDNRVVFHTDRYTTRAVQSNEPMRLAQFVMRLGLARDQQGAKRVLLAIVILCIAVVIVLLLPYMAFAEGLVPCGNPGEGECDFVALVELIRLIIEFMVTLSVFVATGLFAWAGVLYFTASGDTGKIERAHKIFYSVMIGFVIILISWLIVDTILKTLTGKGIDEVGRDATSYQMIDTLHNFL